MKQLIRKLSKVADSSQYCLLRSDSVCRSEARTSKDSRRSNPMKRDNPRSREVPAGHLPVYVGEEMERFVVSAEFLNHPIFLELLKRSAQEYGYEQQGVLRIPCSALVFRRILVILRQGIAGDVEELIRLCSTEFE